MGRLVGYILIKISYEFGGMLREKERELANRRDRIRAVVPN